MSSTREQRERQTPSDMDLVERAARRDEAAFLELRNRFEPQLYGWLVTRVGRDHADDVSQDTWLRVWKYLPDYKHDHFRGWLFELARSSKGDFYRKRKEPARGGDREAAALTESAITDSQFDDLVRTEERLQLARCLEALDAAMRKIVVDRCANVRYEIIAARLQITTEQAHRRYHTAKDALRRCVEGWAT